MWRTRSTASASGFRSPSKPKMTVIVRSVPLMSSISAPSDRIRASTSARWRWTRPASSGESPPSLSFTCMT